MIDRLSLSRGSVFALLGLALAGCNGDAKPQAPGPLHQVKGKVKLEIPGSVTGMRIAFIQDVGGARTARGDIKPDGSFELTTDAPNDGIGEGNYLICFEKNRKDAKSTLSTLPATFLDADRSGLTATIKPDTTEVTVVVRKP